MGKPEFISQIIKEAVNDPAFKKRLLDNPRETIESRINFKLPADFEIYVHHDTPSNVHIVLPAAGDELSETELAAVSGGICWSEPGCEEYGHCDIKLKNNTEPAGTTLEKIKHLQPKTFSYRRDGIFAEMKLPAGTHFGFIAQELENVFPELVRDSVFVSTNNEEVKYKSIALIEMIPILTQAIKEQQEIIEQLKNEIEQIKRLEN